MACFLENARTMASIMQRHFSNQLCFGVFRAIKRPVRNHKTSMFLTLLKLKKEEKKKEGEGEWDYLNHILQTLASLPVWGSRCQVATRRTFLRAGLLTFANRCPQWNNCLGPCPWTRRSNTRKLPKCECFHPGSRGWLCALATHAHWHCKEVSVLSFP